MIELRKLTWDWKVRRTEGKGHGPLWCASASHAASIRPLCSSRIDSCRRSNAEEKTGRNSAKGCTQNMVSVDNRSVHTKCVPPRPFILQKLQQQKKRQVARTSQKLAARKDSTLENASHNLDLGHEQITHIACALVEPDHKGPPLVFCQGFSEENRYLVALDSGQIVFGHLHASTYET